MVMMVKLIYVCSYPVEKQISWESHVWSNRLQIEGKHACASKYLTCYLAI